VKQLKELLESRGNVWVIREFLLSLMINEFVTGRVGSEEAGRLRELILDIVARSFRYHSNAERSHHRNQLATELDTERRRWDPDSGGETDELVA
jgi:hypothetical protein